LVDFTKRSVQLREHEPEVEETEEVGDYFEDVDNRRGWIKEINGSVATCIVYGSSPRLEVLELVDLVKKVTVC
jgi:hypothetical protein